MRNKGPEIMLIGINDQHIRLFCHPDAGSKANENQEYGG
jgi:hypothetical protein